MVVEMTQKEYAAHIGISEGYLSKRLAKGEVMPGILGMRKFGATKVFTVDLKAKKNILKKV